MKIKLLVKRSTASLSWISLDVIDSVRRLDFQSDGLTCEPEGLNKNLHASTKTTDKVKRTDKVKSRFLLNVVFRLGMTIFELVSGEDQALLVGNSRYPPSHDSSYCHKINLKLKLHKEYQITQD